MYDDICYKQPFLKEVICKINFGSAIESFSKTTPPKKIAKVALKNFPIFEPQKGHAQTVKLSDGRPD